MAFILMTLTTTNRRIAVNTDNIRFMSAEFGTGSIIDFGDAHIVVKEQLCDILELLPKG